MQGDLKAVGDRIEMLLEASSSGGAMQRERAEELVGLLTGLYGDGLERILDILHHLDRLDDVVLAALADDHLIAGLLHGLHPYSMEHRVQATLAELGPSLAAQGADIALVGIDDAGVVRLRLTDQGSGCGSTAAALTASVQAAVEEAAPEAAAIHVETPPRTPGVISPDSWVNGWERSWNFLTVS